MVVQWHKLGEVEIECTLHNFVVLVINGPKIITVGKNLTKLWEKQLWLFFFPRHGIFTVVLLTYIICSQKFADYDKAASFFSIEFSNRTLFTAITIKNKLERNSQGVEYVV